jgi:hypothetical protein
MEWVLSGLFGIAVGFVTAIVKSRVDVGAQVDQQLREARADAYKALWSHTGVLPRWPRRQDVTFADLEKLSETLRDWYFSGSGLYLSRESFDRYAEVQETLTAAVVSDTSKPLGAEVYDSLRKKCSALRSSLADDLQSRRPQSLWPI